MDLPADNVVDLAAYRALRVAGSTPPRAGGGHAPGYELGGGLMPVLLMAPFGAPMLAQIYWVPCWVPAEMRLAAGGGDG